MWIVKDAVRKMVTFSQLNLKEMVASMIGPFDIIFLRNVIIYFSDEFKRRLFQQIRRMLTKDGVLFLGSSESIGAYSDAFAGVECGKAATYYRLK